MSETDLHLRQTAIHLLRSGKSPAQVAHLLNRSLAWVYKWQRRFAAGQWAALQDQSHAPAHQPHRLTPAVREAIRHTRSVLEAEATQPGTLSYIGASTIHARLQADGVTPLPSLTSIERELRAAGMVRPARHAPAPAVHYPHLQPTAPLQLVQVDIVPHALPGGAAVACFNAIDVVSRYPTGQALPRKRALDAVAFLLHVWQEVGLPDFTQVDNEGCFSGGFTHPGVLGQVIRVALFVGTQLVFSPIRHPQSNGTVERFHQDYCQHVWAKYHLPDVAAVQAAAATFFAAYRQSRHHSALAGHCPAEVHPTPPFRRLSSERVIPNRLPLTPGAVHFLRAVHADHTVTLLNLPWAVPAAEPDHGVWVTLTFTLHGAWVRIYDAAPDAPNRRMLAEHPFPLKEAVQSPPACPPDPDMDQSRPHAPVALLEATLDLTVGWWVNWFLRCGEGCD